MAQTMEQKRAAHAWKVTQGRGSEYTNLAKGLPMLIMQSGLMQTLAFLQEKGSKSSQAHCKILAEHLREWLSSQFSKVVPNSEFSYFMEGLMNAKTLDYQLINAEAYAWLRWVRQISSAVNIKVKEK
jgi:CRISPR-associated protein Cmr5